MFKFSDRSTFNEVSLKVKSMIEKLLDDIPELKRMEVGLNVNTKPSAFDLVLTSDFDDVFIHENLVVCAEYTTSKPENVGDHGEPVPGFGCSDCRCASHLYKVNTFSFLEKKGLKKYFRGFPLLPG